MGRPWFPLALLGFALLAMVGYSLGYGSWFAWTPLDEIHQQGLGTGEVGGTGYATTQAVMFASTAARHAVSWGPGIHAESSAWLVVNIGVYLGTVVFYAVRSRRRGTPIRRRWLVALMLGGPVAILLLDLTAFWELRLDGDVRGPLLAACGLLVLAWLERSRLLLVVAVLFALADVVLVTGMAGALLAAAILFAGAFVTLLRTPRRLPGGTVENGPGEH
jgi:hypothetical protein